MTDKKYLILLIRNVLLLILGLFLHSAAAIIQKVGIDPVHFDLIVTLDLAIGRRTPPVASVLITACAMAKADIWETTKVNIYYIGVLPEHFPTEVDTGSASMRSIAAR